MFLRLLFFNEHNGLLKMKGRRNSWTGIENGLIEIVDEDDIAVVIAARDTKVFAVL